MANKLLRKVFRIVYWKTKYSIGALSEFSWNRAFKIQLNRSPVNLFSRSKFCPDVTKTKDFEICSFQRGEFSIQLLKFYMWSWIYLFSQIEICKTLHLSSVVQINLYQIAIDEYLFLKLLLYNNNYFVHAETWVSYLLQTFERKLHDDYGHLWCIRRSYFE